MVSYADPLILFQKEWVWQVFSHECHQAVITFNQVCPDIIPIIVSVYVFPPEQGICAVMGQYGQNDPIVS